MTGNEVSNCSMPGKRERVYIDQEVPLEVIPANNVRNQESLGLELLGGGGATYTTKETPGKSFMIPNKVMKLFSPSVCVFKGRFLTFMVPIQASFLPRRPAGFTLQGVFFVCVWLLKEDAFWKGDATPPFEFLDFSRTPSNFLAPYGGGGVWVLF